MVRSPCVLPHHARPHRFARGVHRHGARPLTGARDRDQPARRQLAQFNGWRWGKREGRRRAPRWTMTWLAFLAGGYALIATGLDPIELTEYAVVLSVVALPLTYLPILLVAGDRSVMGRHANGVIARTLGWGYFIVVCALAVAAPVLLIATNGGGG